MAVKHAVFYRVKDGYYMREMGRVVLDRNAIVCAPDAEGEIARDPEDINCPDCLRIRDERGLRP